MGDYIYYTQRLFVKTGIDFFVLLLLLRTQLVLRVEAAVIVVAVFVVVVVCSFEYLRLPPARKNCRGHRFTRQVLLRYSSSSGLHCHLRSLCTLPRARTHARSLTHTHSRTR